MNETSLAVRPPNTQIASPERETIGSGESNIFRLGQTFFESGYFQDAKSAAQATIKILAGREMGFEPFVSMANIHVVQGKPVLGATLIAAAIKKSGKYTFRVLQHDAQGCEIEFYERDHENKMQPIGKSAFTVEDATKAGLAGKDNWRKHPADMMFARAISRGAKWHCPDVFGGVVYTPGEIEDAPAGERENGAPGKVLPMNRAAEQNAPSSESAPEGKSNVERVHLNRNELTTRAHDLCRQIKEAGDLSLDSSKKLDLHINQKFEIMGGIKNLPLDKFSDLFDDLEEKLTKAKESNQENRRAPADISEADEPPF